MWSEPFEGCDPIEAAARLRPLGRLAFLDSAAPGGPNGRRSAILAAPFAEFTASLQETRLAGARIQDEPFAALDALLGRYRAEATDASRLGPGLAGFFAFEAGHFVEHLRAVPDLAPDRPLIALGLFDTALVFDHETGRADLVSAGFSAALDAASPRAAREAEARTRIACFRDALSRPAPALPPPPPVAAPPGAPTSTKPPTPPWWSEVRDFIRAGDIYQANVARRLTAALPDGFDPFGFYRVLRRINPAPFAAYLEVGDRTIASASPELFLRLHGHEVETRPIKGTARRASDPPRMPPPPPRFSPHARIGPRMS